VPKFTPDEAMEIELLLWEYDRDGSIVVDNFIHRESKETPTGLLDVSESAEAVIRLLAAAT
jgi:hypothetical protein